jgi:hypothetical protein
MTKTKLWSEGAVIIPAQTGWFAAIADTGPEKKLHKEPVIAWQIEWNEDKDAHVVWPITFNPNRNSLFGMTPGYVLEDPHGNFTSTYYDEKLETMTSEAEAIEHSLNEIAACEAGVVRVVTRKLTPVSPREGDEN